MRLRADVSGRTLVSVRVLLAPLLLLGLALAGCGRARPPTVAPTDGGPPIDTGPAPSEDTDGDGLCNRNELSRGTDPAREDTDVDGFSDYIEAQAGSDPFSVASPNRDQIVFLGETDGASVEVPITFTVRGIGETFIGSFRSGLLPIPDGDRSAVTFYAGARTAGASPMENVRGTAENERFSGVFGRTLLAFSVRFEQRELPRGCMRAYPFTYALNRDDGTYAGSVSRWLVIAPTGMRPGATAAVWCGPADGGCY